jgi:STE24 endopeptidase
MSPVTVSLVFSAALLASLATRYWLATRQMRHVAAHRDRVPEAFATTVTAQAHRKAADYTLAKGRFGLAQQAYGTALLLGWTLLGGLDLLNNWALGWSLEALGPLGYQVVLVALFSLIAGLLDLPFDALSTFRIEQRFGFNRVTPGLWLADLFKGTFVGALVGMPLVALVLWLMDAAGSMWWLWAWLAWMSFNLLLLVIYPTWIAPLFNRFEPLKDEGLRQRVEALMQRCGFAAQGLFVMDGSRRSAHANAYFTGMGRAKRVVFYDTLLNKLTPGEVEAVLAHELGHFHHRHVLQRIALLAVSSLIGLALLGWLAGQASFYTGLGVQPHIGVPQDAVALLLFMLALPPFTFFLSPLMARGSRRHEFQADAYACAQVDGRALASALLKLHEDNAATLTPDPLFVRFYYSHPPASERLAALTKAATVTQPGAAPG